MRESQSKYLLAPPKISLKKPLHRVDLHTLM
jgi:hypothetical protein